MLKAQLKVSPGFAIFVLLCFNHSYFANSAIKSFENYHKYPLKEIKLHRHSLKEGILVYAVCDNPAQGNNCTIVQERYPDGKTQRICNVSLEFGQENATFTSTMYVSAFGMNKAILFWDEIGLTTFFKLLTVNMDNCQTGSLVLPDPFMNIYNELYRGRKIVTYEKIFEIFFKSSNLADETNDVINVMTIDSRGFVVKNETNFMKSKNSTLKAIWPIDIGSPEKSYAYTKYLDEKYILAIRRPDGSEKVLASHDRKFFTEICIDNELIALYVRGISTTTCTQFDKEGNVKFNITFDDDKYRVKVSTRGTYNLPGGGFLILFVEYIDSEDYYYIDNYTVVKFDSEGKKVGSIRLNRELVDVHNDASRQVGTYIWGNENEEYCVAEISTGIAGLKNSTEPFYINVAVNCFTETDFDE